MTTQTLLPQPFGPNAVTQLPAIDFYQYALAQLPQVYQNAPNFLAVITVISTAKQYLYDLIRSLVNSYNLNDTGEGDDSAEPTGIYAQMIASVFNTPYTTGASDSDIINATQQVTTFVNSHGYPSDFYDYFLLNGFDGYFTNANVEEDGNATIFFNLPIQNTPSNPPNPYFNFINSTLKLKGAGINVILNTIQTPYFQYGSLPTDNPPYEVAPGNAGFGILEPRGDVINGGFYQST